MRFTMAMLAMIIMGCSGSSGGGGGATPQTPVVTSVSLSGSGVSVVGQNLDAATAAKMNSETLDIVEKSPTLLRLQPRGKLALVAGLAASLLLETAHGSTTSTSITLEAAAVTCPDGWAKITAGGGKSYSVCIEKTATSSTSAIGPAQIACLNKGASLCFANELYALCGQVAEAGATIGATEEWFEAIDSKGASTAVSLGAQPSAQGYFSNCSASGSTTNAAAAARYRCCRR